ncbi:MAG: hypothetical protein JKY49_01070 [Cohaesibacteraceae bacterium]|nr:hypothetical protein [Cohaesibacteraceae bacterium]
METYQVSQRRAYDVLQVDRSSMRYQSRRGDDTEPRDAIKQVSRARRRFGYRRIHVMVAREGFVVNQEANGVAGRSQSMLEPGFRLRCVARRPPISGFDRYR